MEKREDGWYLGNDDLKMVGKLFVCGDGPLEFLFRRLFCVGPPSLFGLLRSCLGLLSLVEEFILPLRWRWCDVESLIT